MDYAPGHKKGYSRRNRKGVMLVGTKRAILVEIEKGLYSWIQKGAMLIEKGALLGCSVYRPQEI